MSTAAQALADVATIAILQHRATLEAQVLNEQLQHALNSRIVIEQAKGMVAERTGTRHGTGVLRAADHARNHNLRLVDVAEAVISGALAPPALDRLPRGERRHDACQPDRPSERAHRDRPPRY